MKHGYNAEYWPADHAARLPEWSVVKWEAKIGKTIAQFGQDGEETAIALAEKLNKNPIWIIIDDGVIFEGHQGHWADCFFSNSYEKQIRSCLEHDTLFPGTNTKYVIREMTDAEVEKYPEALEFREELLKEYGEF